MKEWLQSGIILFVDLVVIFLSLSIAYFIRLECNVYFATTYTNDFSIYATFELFYITIIGLFFYEGIYFQRFDFWHESRLVFKGLLFSFVLIMAYVGLTHTIHEYSRFVISLAFIFMVFLIPIAKNISKKMLFRIGLWQREAKIYGEDSFIKEEIFDNPYLGYVEASNKIVKTVFINSMGMSAEKLSAIVEEKLSMKQEVIYIPIINEYDLTQSNIYELSNARTNLVVLQNNLKNKYKIFLKLCFDLLSTYLLLIILSPILLVIYLIVYISTKGHPLFTQERIGQDGKKFKIFKFRSMYIDADKRLEQLLESSKEYKEEWERDFKLKNDPRITSIGNFLRKTSLDELPQLINILKGEMSLVGPRPIVEAEIQKYGEYFSYFKSVKPGITGLWQISGRNDIEYNERVQLDVWYVKNWCVALDIQILIKTVLVVLCKKGSY